MIDLECYVDGASKGNPGHAGIGVVICRDGEVIENISEYIGQATNNVAEYTALIRALQKAASLRADRLSIKTDSELVYRQLKREYKVKSSALAELYAQAVRLLAGFGTVKLAHVPREQNKGADKLATLAVKQHVRGRRQAAASPDKGEEESPSSSGPA